MKIVSDEASSPLRIWLPAIRAGSGADVFVERLAVGLRAAGHEPIVEWFDHKLELAPSNLRKIPMPSGTDVIHAGSWQGFAFRRAGVPLVVTEHHDVMDPDYRPYKSRGQALYHRLMVDRWMRRSFSSASAVTAVSAFTARVLIDHRGLSAKVVQNWIDTEEFSPGPGIQRSDALMRLLFVGNMSRRKGADILPGLAERLGDGFEIHCTEGLRQRSNTNSSSRIKVLGRLSKAELISAYRSCDAVLVPSRYEGFGYAALEGMACGKPIVSFRSEAVAEVVGEPGLATSCAVDDVDGLARICRSLSADPSWRVGLGHEARQRAVRLFNGEESVNAYVRVYLGAIAASN